MPSPFAARLASRGIVQVSGVDALRFLQSLVTNDVHTICHPSAPTSLSAFLNGRGRLLFGALMHRADDHRYLLDLPAERCSALLKHLTMYRLRADVHLADVSQDHDIWAIVGAEEAAVEGVANDAVLYDDPRLAALGKRAIVSKGYQGFDAMERGSEADYTRLRILHGVPDDADFLGTPLPLDLALHLLHGVSFAKGCYLGQELTARSHFTGVLRKRLTPFAVVDAPSAVAAAADVFDPTTLLSASAPLALQQGTPLYVQGKKKPAGTVTSSVDNVGLAVVRLDDVFPPGVVTLGDGRTACAWRPAWWDERAADAVPVDE